MPRRIPTHRPVGQPTPRQAAAAYDRGRREDKRWYDREPWPTVRRAKLQQSPLCEDCLGRGLTVAAEHVHHVQERRDRPDLAYDLANLQSLCRSCHNAKRRKGAQPTPEGGHFAGI